MHSCAVQVENAETIKRMHGFGPISALCARQRSAFSSSSDRPPWPWQLSAAFQIQNFFSIFQTISGFQYLSDSFSLHFSVFFVVFSIFLPRCFKEAFLGGRASQAVVFLRLKSKVMNLSKAWFHYGLWWTVHASPGCVSRVCCATAEAWTCKKIVDSSLQVLRPSAEVTVLSVLWSTSNEVALGVTMRHYAV